MTKKLTPRQEQVLSAIKKTGKANYAHYMGRFGGGYWWVDSIDRCTASVKALIERGYLDVKREGVFGDKIATIKEQ